MTLRRSLYARPEIVRGQHCTSGAGRLWSRAVGTMVSALVPSAPGQGLARDLPETAPRAASPRPTTQPSAAPFTSSVVWEHEVLQGVVNHPRINGKDGVAGSIPAGGSK